MDDQIGPDKMLPPPMIERGALLCSGGRRGSSTSCISRILRLALLGPDIVETILERPLPASWEEQRQRFS
jgi:hypothetical protein